MKIIYASTAPPANNTYRIARGLACFAAFVTFVALAALPALAQPLYPTRPIRFIVPFPPGGGNDIVGRRLQLIISTMASALPQIKAERLRPLAVTTAQRSLFFAQIPTMEEAGVKGYEFSTWYGLLVPAGTPWGIVARLNSETARALDSALVREQFGTQGLDATRSTPQAFGAYLRAEVAKWGKVILASGARPE